MRLSLMRLHYLAEFNFIDYKQEVLSRIRRWLCLDKNKKRND
jgi:hypothetical protein